MASDVVLVFELISNAHWMKDVVQLPLALARRSKGVAHVIARPNHRQDELVNHINLHLYGYEKMENYSCFENSNFTKVISDSRWYSKACKKAASIGGILILYPFFGNPCIGALLYKIQRWLRLRKAIVIIKSDGTLANWTKQRICYLKILTDWFKYLFIDIIICENESIYLELKTIHHHLFNKIAFIPNCPIKIYNSQKINPYITRPNNFLFVGRISDEEKGADILLEAWLKINKSIPDWKLQMIGPCTEEFKKRFSVNLPNEEGLNSVFWVSDLAPEDLIKYYNNSKIVVCCSRKESGPIILSEAGLCGCAFIGTAVGEIPDILEGLPGLVIDSKRLPEIMLQFANNPETLAKQANHIFNRLKNRDWDEQVKILPNIY
jgi:glycosyltransferase involved in cell wall biosynthesis